MPPVARNRHVHTIGLMGPWECAWTAAGEQLPRSWCRLRLPPGDSGLPKPPGKQAVLWLRRFFHRPTGLQPGDAVWLVFAGWPAGSKLWLNEVPLGRLAAEEERREVTLLLAPRNALCVQLPLGGEPRPPLQRVGVVLEISSNEDLTA